MKHNLLDMILDHAGLLVVLVFVVGAVISLFYIFQPQLAWAPDEVQDENYTLWHPENINLTQSTFVVKYMDEAELKTLVLDATSENVHIILTDGGGDHIVIQNTYNPGVYHGEVALSTEYYIYLIQGTGSGGGA